MDQASSPSRTRHRCGAHEIELIKENTTEQVGDYVVTPLINSKDLIHFDASVSIRRGAYDRVFRFIPQFSSQILAAQYALAEGRSMVLCKQLN